MTSCDATQWWIDECDTSTGFGIDEHLLWELKRAVQEFKRNVGSFKECMKQLADEIEPIYFDPYRSSRHHSNIYLYQYPKGAGPNPIGICDRNGRVASQYRGLPSVQLITGMRPNTHQHLSKGRARRNRTRRMVSRRPKPD